MPCYRESHRPRRKFQTWLCAVGNSQRILFAALGLDGRAWSAYRALQPEAMKRSNICTAEICRGSVFNLFGHIFGSFSHPTTHLCGAPAPWHRLLHFLPDRSTAVKVESHDQGFSQVSEKGFRTPITYTLPQLVVMLLLLLAFQHIGVVVVVVVGVAVVVVVVVVACLVRALYVLNYCQYGVPYLDSYYRGPI